MLRRFFMSENRASHQFVCTYKFYIPSKLNRITWNADRHLYTVKRKEIDSKFVGDNTT